MKKENKLSVKIIKAIYKTKVKEENGNKHQINHK